MGRGNQRGIQPTYALDLVIADHPECRRGLCRGVDNERLRAAIRSGPDELLETLLVALIEVPLLPSQIDSVLLLVLSSIGVVITAGEKGEKTRETVCMDVWRHSHGEAKCVECARSGAPALAVGGQSVLWRGARGARMQPAKHQDTSLQTCQARQSLSFIAIPCFHITAPLMRENDRYHGNASTIRACPTHTTRHNAKKHDRSARPRTQTHPHCRARIHKYTHTHLTLANSLLFGTPYMPVM